MTDPVQAAAAELTALIPHLDAALTRDNTVEGNRGVTAGVPVNMDVLKAVVILKREVPAARQRACDLIREPCHRQPVLTCLRILPRLSDRMVTLGHADEVTWLEQAARHWVREVKLALGLRTRDIPIGALCPYCPGDGLAQLTATGEEWCYRKTAEGPRIERVNREASIYCPSCSASWGPAEWPLLDRMLTELAEAVA